jgi:hypothetical protein
MKIKSLISSLVIAGSALAATGTKSITQVIPTGVDLNSLTGALTSAPTYAGLGLPGIDRTFDKFDPMAMVDVPDDAFLVSVSYTLAGKFWFDWTVTSGVDPVVSYLNARLTLTGPSGTATTGNLSGTSPVLVGSSGTFILDAVPVSFNVLDANEGLFDATVSGAGTVSFNLRTHSGAFFGVLGETEIDGSVSPFAAGNVTVNYNWAQPQGPEVPEASTYAAAFAMAGLVGFRWLRSRR